MTADTRERPPAADRGAGKAPCGGGRSASDDTTTPRHLRAALAYAERGWHVFPCAPGEKRPATAHGCHDATTDGTRIREWWTAEPSYNVAVATGPSGLFVVDVDGPEGHESIVALQRAHGPLGDPLWQRTPSGGWHAVYANPDGLGNTSRRLGDGLDTRGQGGYVVVAPSVHPNGGRYAWRTRGEPPPPPAWLTGLLTPPPRPPCERVRVDRPGDLGRYVRAALDDECREVARTPEGGRNDRLNVAAYNLGRLVGAGALDADTARCELLDAAAACGLGEREAGDTIKSGLTAGAARPREGVRS